MEQPNRAIKLCECGCGEPAPIATASNPRRGIVKGQPQHFVRGHSMRGSNHYGWRGNDVSYEAIHAYLRNHFPKSGVCVECGERKPTEYALIKGRSYTKDRNDYQEMCKRCHNVYDDVGYRKYWALRGQSRDAVGEAPACGCGCGALTNWNRPHKQWNRYVTGHYRRDAPYKDQAWLREQFDLRGRSFNDIAAECGVNRTVVKKFLVKYDIRRSAPHTETCAECSTEFETRPQANRPLRFCSSACRAKYRRDHGADDVKRICHQCGAPFTVNRYESKSHCSQSCAATCQHAEADCPR